MIYIKDYRSLNSLICNHNNSISGIQLELTPLIGRTITVFVEGGSIYGCSFTGVLIDVLSDRIKLITKLPTAPNHSMRSCGSGFNVSHRRKSQGSGFGTKTFIILNHITAFAYAGK